jgi:hypothetical protein
MKLSLPNTLRRAELRSFCLAISSIALTALVLAASLSSDARYATLSVVGGCLLGVMFPSLARIPYRIWNKAAKLFARFTQYYLLSMVFHIIVRPMSLAMRSREFSQKSDFSSCWVPRASVSPTSYRSLYQISKDNSSGAPWPLTVFSWAWRTNNIPAIFLLPFLYVISLFQPEQESEKISDIYTLF